MHEHTGTVIFQEEGLTAVEQELRDLKDSLQDTQPVGSLVKCCKTLDQVQLKKNQIKKVLVKFINQEYQSKNRNRLLEGVQWMNFNSSGKSQTNMVFDP